MTSHFCRVCKSDKCIVNADLPRTVAPFSSHSCHVRIVLQRKVSWSFIIIPLSFSNLACRRSWENARYCDFHTSFLSSLFCVAFSFKCFRIVEIYSFCVVNLTNYLCFQSLNMSVFLTSSYRTVLATLKNTWSSEWAKKIKITFDLVIICDGRIIFHRRKLRDEVRFGAGAVDSAAGPRPPEVWTRLRLFQGATRYLATLSSDPDSSLAEMFLQQISGKISRMLSEFCRLFIFHLDNCSL